MDNENLHKLQMAELKLACEVKRICEKNGIQYFLICGTLLGAVRHKGFIPWDDDMDLGMRRSEYDKFLSAAQRDLGDEYFLQTWDTDQGYPFSHAKLRLNGTAVVEKMNKDTEAHNGVFIDIFPYDNVPSSRLRQRIQAARIYVYKKLMWIKKGYGKEFLSDKNSMFKLKYYMGKALSVLWTYDRLKSNFSKTLKKYNNKNSDEVFNTCYYSYNKSKLRSEWLSELRSYAFEGTDFSAPVEYDKILTAMYGDYMQLPPEEKRHTHEILSFEYLSGVGLS